MTCDPEYRQPGVISDALYGEDEPDDELAACKAELEGYVKGALFALMPDRSVQDRIIVGLREYIDKLVRAAQGEETP